MLIDSHVNLHAPPFDADREAVIARARAAGGARLMLDHLRQVWTVASTPYRPIAEAHAGRVEHCGSSPARSQVDLPTPRRWTELIQSLPTGPKRRGRSASCGLDFHYDRSPRESSSGAVFAVHIAAAQRTLGLPLVVHTREADDETMAQLLEAAWDARQPLKVLLHCYTGGPELAVRGRRRGAPGFSGLGHRHLQGGRRGAGA